jgi:CubicO group peptidase (beta-lactamase class C family)
MRRPLHPLVLCAALVVIGRASAIGAQAPEVPPRAAGEVAARVAAPPTTEVRDLAEMLRPIRERHDLPALAAAVVVGDETIALGVDGVRKRGSPEKVERDDRWHLGSCTKAIAATWIATFVDERKLAWSTTVGEVFGERIPLLDPAWKPVTIEMLLAHRGGAPAELDADGLWLQLWNAKGTPVEQRLQLVDGVLRRPPSATPGTKHVYSNAGYAIAAAMTETKAGVDWESSVRERVFVPLGMTTAGFGAPGTRGEIDEPRGHSLRGDPIEIGPGDDNPVAISPAGKVHMSIGDWAKFAAFHLALARGEERILSKETARRIHAPFVPADGAADPRPYGFGWGFVERPWAGGRALSHAGSNTMWYCVAWIAPEKDFAVLVATNQGGEKAMKACDEVAAQLVEEGSVEPREDAARDRDAAGQDR